MKTLQDLYEEVVNSDEEKKAFVEAMRAGDVEGFLKRHDCDASAEELAEFLGSRATEDAPAELSMEELESIAGGSADTLLEPTMGSCEHNDGTTSIYNCGWDCDKPWW